MMKPNCFSFPSSSNNRFTREYLMLDWKHDGPREVDWVSGAAA